MNVRVRQKQIRFENQKKKIEENWWQKWNN